MEKEIKENIGPRTERDEIFNLYSESFNGWWDRFYFNVKWRRGSAIEVAEKYVPDEGLIIDVGCGTGIFDNYLLLKSDKRRIMAFDLDKKRIEIAKKTIKTRKNIQFYVEDIRNLRLNDCDCIILYDVLHHIDHNQQVNLLRECYNKLKKGGVLLIKDVNKGFSWRYLVTRMVDTIANFVNITEGNLCFKSEKQFKQMLKNVGFNLKIINPKIRDFVPHIIIRCFV